MVTVVNEQVHQVRAEGLRNSRQRIPDDDPMPVPEAMRNQPATTPVDVKGHEDPAMALVGVPLQSPQYRNGTQSVVNAGLNDKPRPSGPDDGVPAQAATEWHLSVPVGAD